MTNIIGSKVGTYTLTGEKSITFDAADNISKISLLCTSDTLCTLTGQTMSIDGNASSSISVPKNMPVYLEGLEGRPLDGLTLTVPSGCTVLLFIIR